MIFARLIRLVLRRPRSVLAGAFLFLVVGGIIGAPVMISLPAGGYQDPASESSRAQRIIEEQFHEGGMSLILEISSPAGVDDPATRARADQVTATLKASPYAGKIISYWAAPNGFSNALATTDHKTGLVATQVAGSDSVAPNRARDIVKSIVGEKDGVTVTAGGQSILYNDLTDESRNDLIRVEIIAVPLTFLVMVWIFGSAIASALPMAVSVVSIAVTLAVLRILSSFTDVSVFALNLTTAVSLALAIDYTLLIVNRFRENVSQGIPRDQALVRTMTTTGRAVTYSALTVAAIAATMMVFPTYLMRSFAYAGVTSAAVSLAGALIIAPAMIVLLGDRLDAFDIRKPLRRWLGRPTVTEAQAPEQSFFYRNAVFAMRFAVPVVLAITLMFVALGLPFLNIKIGLPDDRMLPLSAPSAHVGDSMRSDYSQNFAGTDRVLLVDGQYTDQALTQYAQQLSKVSHVTSVSAPNGTFVNGAQMLAAPVGPAARSGDAAYLTISTTLDPYSHAGKDQLQALKDVPAPATTLFDGLAQVNNDYVDSTLKSFPWVLVLIGLITFVLMFLLTGSVVLPIKGLVMNVMSLGAAFGAVVWLFQEGHLGGLGTTTTGLIAGPFVPLILCLAYALSMDYEVFVMSRIREEWLKSDRTAKGNERAIAIGLGRAGKVVTAAALVMAIVFAAMIASHVATMRMLGVALTVAIVFDAFLIRILLIPAFMKLMGRANWWGPKALSRLHEKWAVNEDNDLPEPDPSGDHLNAEEADPSVVG
ncbi:MMPL family transporter [Nocardia yamanashiensis]|uniref:MMPL family transporter n=1 Tax=Nocardia yamanashiensis TaxID=209247 RepID=UPI001E2B8B05|nr:MMPL family transporter [Nocardia yamanashiensis]UGT42573.1 MMPL family transporter [Nocardia yamanashiensis]